MTPRFPSAGPDGHGSPPSAVLSGRYDSLPSHVLRLIGFASRLRRRLPGSCSPWALPSPYRPGGGPGSGLFTLAVPFQRSRPRARAGSPRFPGDPSRDFALVYDPGRPVAPRQYRRFRCCPHTDNNEGVIASRFRGLLRRFVTCWPTLQDARCRTPCKARFRLAGCAFAGRGSNPLDRDERFQFMASSSPGLGLALYPFGGSADVEASNGSVS